MRDNSLRKNSALRILPKVQFKSYLKINTYSGKDTATQSDYEILDENTFLDKTQLNVRLTEKLYAFTHIFNPDVSNPMLINCLNFISNCFEGIDQMVIMYGDHPLRQSYLIGSVGNSGFLIETMSLILNQISQPYQTRSRVFFSAFSNEGERNTYLDLLVGHRYKFSSKKSMDIYKTFYERQILDLRQFLICLKIILTRFEQCCSNNDSIAFRITIQHFDEFKNEIKHSTLHIVYAEEDIQWYNNLIKRIETIHQSVNNFGNDSGDLINLLQKYVKCSQIKFLLEVRNKRSSIDSALKTIQDLSALNGKIYQCADNDPYKGEIKGTLDRLYQQIKEPTSTIVNTKHQSEHLQINAKGSAILQKIKAGYITFFVQNCTKLINYTELLEKDMRVRLTSFQEVRFPVSLEIKDSNVKSFYIAKLYGLSEKFKMEDMGNIYQKMKSIKNQVLLSLASQQKVLLKYANDYQLGQTINMALLSMNLTKRMLKAFLSVTSLKLSSQKIDLNIFKPQVMLSNKSITGFSHTENLPNFPKVRVGEFSVRNLLQGEEHNVSAHHNSFHNFNIYKAHKLIGHKSRLRAVEKDKGRQNVSHSLPRVIILRKNQ